MRRSDGFIVPGMSRGEIRERTDEIRSTLNIQTAAFPIVDVVEFVLPATWDTFLLEIVDVAEMNRRFGPDTHGMTYPDELHMIVREDVYLGACQHEALPRFSLAHELGHLLMHAGGGMARRVAMTTPIYANSEWQADAFAGELLVSWRQISWDDTPHSIARRFNVSYAAARTMYNVFREEGML